MALYDWKREHCLQSMDGMFAFVIWDKIESELFCARDRFGEKPFYYTIDDHQRLLFASEMKALWAVGVKKQADETMVYNYLANSLVEDPTDRTSTFYSNIKKLAPAHYLLLKEGHSNLSQNKYWDIDLNNQNGGISTEEAQARLRELFFTSISRRLRSDVPVGSSLSGGVDSSLVVCAIDVLNKDNKIIQKTFSAQFPGSKKDESRYQQLIVDGYDIQAFFVRPSTESLQENLQTLVYHQEEPFVHASIAAQYEVFKLAKENNVTVLLDGQGADEIFAGYHQFYRPYLKGLKGKDNASYKRERQAFLHLHSDNKINYSSSHRWKSYLKKVIPLSLQSKLQTRMNQGTLLERKFVNNATASRMKRIDFDSLQQALYYETVCSGLETLLRYADRSSMANSREVRLPFLSHELVEFVFSLPDDFKIRDGWTKWIMRTSFDQIVPKEILWRKDKIGYEPPQEAWLKEKEFQKTLQQSVQCLRDHHILNGKKEDVLQNPFFSWRIVMTANTVFT
jgi:asparagine synthase (glutamine-hydrolysing)